MWNRIVSLKLYLVTCDFLAPGDYASFREKMRTLDATQILQAQWAVRSVNSAEQLRDDLKGFLDRGDAITVVEVGEERASRRAKADLARVRSDVYDSGNGNFPTELPMKRFSAQLSAPNIHLRDALPHDQTRVFPGCLRHRAA